MKKDFEEDPKNSTWEECKPLFKRITIQYSKFQSTKDRNNRAFTIIFRKTFFSRFLSLKTSNITFLLLKTFNIILCSIRFLFEEPTNPSVTKLRNLSREAILFIWVLFRKNITTILNQQTSMITPREAINKKVVKRLGKKKRNSGRIITGVKTII